MTLTEQWKKGELERGRYYIKYRGNYMQDNWHGDCWEDSWGEYVEEVLAPVPTYEEWQKVLNIDFNNEVLRLENAKLKELLKECKGCVVTLKTKNVTECNGLILSELLTKIDNEIGEKK